MREKEQEGGELGISSVTATKRVKCSRKQGVLGGSNAREGSHRMRMAQVHRLCQQMDYSRLKCEWETKKWTQCLWTLFLKILAEKGKKGEKEDVHGQVARKK